MVDEFFFWYWSMDWFKGKSTGNHRFSHRFSHSIWGFPAIVPLNQSIDIGQSTTNKAVAPCATVNSDRTPRKMAVSNRPGHIRICGSKMFLDVPPAKVWYSLGLYGILIYYYGIMWDYMVLLDIIVFGII